MELGSYCTIGSRAAGEVASSRFRVNLDLFALLVLHFHFHYHSPSLFAAYKHSILNCDMLNHHLDNPRTKTGTRQVQTRVSSAYCNIGISVATLPDTAAYGW